MRAALVAALFVVIIVVLARTEITPSQKTDSIQADYPEYTHCDDDYINNLISLYYTSYADNDTSTLQMIAYPISDAELSYVEFMSRHVELFYVEDIYIKNGPKTGTYLVSVVVDYKFYNINTVAPGLDFFYLDVTDDGVTYINNTYGSFNSENQEYEADPEIAGIIVAFEQEPDVLALEAEVQQAFNDAMLADNDLNVYVSETLQNEMTEWASEYKVKVLSQIGALSDSSESADTAQTAATDTETADAAAGTVQTVASEERAVTSTVNMRSAMDESSDRVTVVYEGEKVTVEADDASGWSKVKYKDYSGYIKTEYLD